jgi:hypothetical protein
MRWLFCFYSSTKLLPDLSGSEGKRDPDFPKPVFKQSYSTGIANIPSLSEKCVVNLQALHHSI